MKISEARQHAFNASAENVALTIEEREEGKPPAWHLRKGGRLIAAGLVSLDGMTATLAKSWAQAIIKRYA